MTLTKHIETSAGRVMLTLATQDVETHSLLAERPQVLRAHMDLLAKDAEALLQHAKESAPEHEGGVS